MAKVVVSEYLAKERVGRSSQDPMFVVRYRSRGGDWQERRMADHWVWKIIKALGRRAGLPELHPHAFIQSPLRSPSKFSERLIR